MTIHVFFFILMLMICIKFCWESQGANKSIKDILFEKVPSWAHHPLAWARLPGPGLLERASTRSRSYCCSATRLLGRRECPLWQQRQVPGRRHHCPRVCPLSHASRLHTGGRTQKSQILGGDKTQLPKRLKTQKKFTGSKIGAIFWQITSRVTSKNLKIGQHGNVEKIDFFSFVLMRQRLSSGQKCFLRPYLPLIRGMFVFRSGLRFSFWAMEGPEPRVRKRSF